MYGMYYITRLTSYRLRPRLGIARSRATGNETVRLPASYAGEARNQPIGGA